MEEIIVFGQRMLELREEKGCSLEDVAKVVGIVKSQLSKYEKGEVEPGLMKAKKIADFYNVTVDYIIGNSDERRPTGKIFADLSEEQKEEVQRYIEYLRTRSENKS